MKYFNEILGKTTYNDVEIVDIFKKYRIPISVNEQWLDDYVLKDGDTPENLSYELYDTTDLWWTIMVLNERYDRFFDFPITDKAMTLYLDYLNTLGQIDSSDSSEVNALKTANDNLREIKVIKPDYIRDFVYKIQDIINART